MIPDEGVSFGGDLGPYRQSERKPMYREYAEQLVAGGFAYYAFDTPEELEQMRERLKASGNAAPQYNHATREYMKNSLVLPAEEVKARLANGDPYVIRIKIPRKEEVKIQDMIRGWVVFHSSQLDDKVLFKSDGMPTYHLAVVVDDHLMNITHVIRGEEWLPSAPVHVLLHEYLGWKEETPQWAHLPLILRPDGNGKLSKRDGDRLGFPVFPLNWNDPTSGEQSKGFRERGFLPSPFINMIALLGWHPQNNQEVFSMPELIEAFSVERIGKSGAKFDFEKAKWFNQEFIKTLPAENIVVMISKTLEEKNIAATPDFILRVADAVRDRIAVADDIWNQSSFFFVKPAEYDPSIVKKKWNEKLNELIGILRTELNSSDNFSAESVDSLLHSFLAKNNLSTGDLLPVLRVMLAGGKTGPGVHIIFHVLGKSESLARMDSAVNTFNQMSVAG